MARDMTDGNEKTIKLVIRIIVIVLLLGILIGIVFYIRNHDGKIYRSEFKVYNKEIISSSKKEQEQCIKELIDYLNEEYYYDCKSIKFYNNTFEKKSKYIYVLVTGLDKSLIEIKKVSDGSYKFEYVGNEITPDNKSETTGVSYLQITNPKKYIKQQKEIEWQLTPEPENNRE